METGGYFLELYSIMEADRAKKLAQQIADDEFSCLNAPPDWQGHSNWSRCLQVDENILYVQGETRLWYGEYGLHEEYDGLNLFEKICMGIACQQPDRSFHGRCVYEDSVTGWSQMVLMRYDCLKRCLDFCFLEADGPGCLCMLKQDEADQRLKKWIIESQEMTGTRSLDGCYLSACQPAGHGCTGVCSVTTHEAKYCMDTNGYFAFCD